MLNNMTDVLSVVLSRHARTFGPQARPSRHQFPVGSQGIPERQHADWRRRRRVGHLRHDQEPESDASGATGAWGAYGAWGASGADRCASPQVPPIPAAFEAAFDPVARIIRLAVSAAKADGTLSDRERAMIMERAREAGLEAVVEAELAQTRPLADIVRGVTDAGDEEGSLRARLRHRPRGRDRLGRRAHLPRAARAPARARCRRRRRRSRPKPRRRSTRKLRTDRQLGR